MQDSVDLDEVAHYEPPHQDLRCLQVQLFFSLVFKELMNRQKFLKSISLFFSNFFKYIFNMIIYNI